MPLPTHRPWFDTTINLPQAVKQCFMVSEGLAMWTTALLSTSEMVSGVGANIDLPTAVQQCAVMSGCAVI